MKVFCRSTWPYIDGLARADPKPILAATLSCLTRGQSGQDLDRAKDKTDLCHHYRTRV